MRGRDVRARDVPDCGSHTPMFLHKSLQRIALEFHERLHVYSRHRRVHVTRESTQATHGRNTQRLFIHAEKGRVTKGKMARKLYKQSAEHGGDEESDGEVEEPAATYMHTHEHNSNHGRSDTGHSVG